MSFRPWHAPAKKIPGTSVSVGLILGWHSTKNPSLPRGMFRIFARLDAFSEGTAAFARTTISACAVTCSPSSFSAKTVRFLAFEVASHVIVKNADFDCLSIFLLQHDCVFECVHAAEA